MKTKLLPCPFCGNGKTLRIGRGIAFIHVGCLTCDSRGPSAMSERDAIRYWNRRAKARKKR